MTEYDKIRPQFRRWARALLKVNPEYVTEPLAIVSYLRGPNWDDPDPEYAHYRYTVECYGKELLEEFEAIRLLPLAEGAERYRALLTGCGFDEAEGRFT